MKKLYILILILILTIIIIPKNIDAKTGVHIETKLDSISFMNPVLSQNNTFVYNNMIIYLYSNDSNTFYNIEINNISISSGYIEDFNRTVYYKFDESYIYTFIVTIGSDKYQYNNIYVFNYDFSNYSDDEEKLNLLEFTKDQYKNLKREIEMRIFSGDMIGVLFALILSNYSVREYKKNQIKEI